jgi:superfamily II DNA or RNA helicase
MPTGSGKTRTAMNVVANYLRNREKGVVVWLAHSEELCEQAADEFAKAWGALVSNK